MAYYESIDQLKQALDGFSAEEERFKQLYETALKNAESAYIDDLKRLDKQYRADRNEAYADTAREDRNTSVMLADRGLGFSGESAQAKLNSNLILANRLSELNSDKNEQAATLTQSLDDKKLKIDSDYASNLADTGKTRLDILKDISDAELQLELADKEIKAERDLQDQKYRNELNLLKASLANKGSSGASGSSGDSGSSGGNNTQSGEQDSPLSGWTPDMKPKDLAKLLVANSTSSNYIKTEDEAFRINKYLLEMQENYDVDEEYLSELVFMLKAYGYHELDSAEIKAEVISRDADAYYWDTYDELFDAMMADGIDESLAKSSAKEQASALCLDYIYNESSKNVDIFRSCAKRLGYSESEIDKYIKRKQLFGYPGIGGTGINPEHDRVNMLK